MKKRYLYLITNIVIIVMICVIFGSIQANELSFYKQLAHEQAENDVSLTATDINAKITAIATEQLVASQMMANDIFLKQWCMNETADPTSDTAQMLYTYLAEYKKTYDYDVVFFVSNKTYNYYYDGGINKVISPDDDFDIWYFNFLNLKQNYDIQIDHDEVNENSVSLFVNYLVTDVNDNILGVVGAGKLIDDFQDSLNDLVTTFDVDICVVNTGNAHNSFKASSGFYKTSEDAAKELGLTEEQVLQNVDETGITWTTDDICFSIKHNEELNWNILVKKDTASIIDRLLKQSYNRVFFLVVLIIVYILISFTFLAKIQHINHIHENTDDLTGLMNNKLFKETYSKLPHLNKGHSSLFILDVDNFKTFNDSYGHLYGNTVLHLVANELMSAIGSDGIISRWGGDEFIGIIYHKSDKALTMLNSVQKKLNSQDTKSTVSFSCGIMDLDSKSTLKESFDKADIALYKAKENGKACCYVYK